MQRRRLAGVVPLLLFCRLSVAGLESSASVWSSGLFGRPEHVDIGLGFSVATRTFADIPDRFDSRSVEPPHTLSLGYRSSLPKKGSGIAWWFRPNLAFTRLGTTPMIGAAAGITPSARPLELDLGLEYQAQHTVGEAPISSSELGASWRALIVNLRLVLARLSLAVDYKYLGATPTQAARFEGLPTQMDWSSSSVLSPNLALRVAGPVLLSAGYQLVTLGSTAILSSNFAAFLPRKSLQTAFAGFSLRFSSFQLGARYSWVMGVDDSLEHFSRAPFLSGMYLLAPQSGTLEARWFLE